MGQNGREGKEIYYFSGVEIQMRKKEPFNPCPNVNSRSESGFVTFPLYFSQSKKKKKEKKKKKKAEEVAGVFKEGGKKGSEVP